MVLDKEVYMVNNCSKTAVSDYDILISEELYNSNPEIFNKVLEHSRAMLEGIQKPIVSLLYFGRVLKGKLRDKMLSKAEYSTELNDLIIYFTNQTTYRYNLLFAKFFLEMMEYKNKKSTLSFIAFKKKKECNEKITIMTRNIKQLKKVLKESIKQVKVKKTIPIRIYNYYNDFSDL